MARRKDKNRHKAKVTPRSWHCIQPWENSKSIKQNKSICYGVMHHAIMHSSSEYYNKLAVGKGTRTIKMSFPTAAPYNGPYQYKLQQ